MLDIDKNTVIEHYNLDFANIIPYKDAYIVNTSSGKKLLRKSILLPERILFVHGVKEHLYKNGLANIDRYICTFDNKPYLAADSGCYTLTDLIDGIECDFDNRDDVINASRLLASMHKASRGYSPPAACVPRDDLGKLPLYFNKRLDEIKKLKKTAKKGLGKFDYLFLNYADYFYSLGENAIQNLSASNYDKVVEKSKEEGIICHHDFTHHNIISNNTKLSVINFEYCCFELKIYDLANFIRRKMRKCNWDIKEARIIMEEYRKIEDISSDELVILKIILQFPQKFWRVVNKYYNSRRSWSEKSFISKLQEVIDEIEFHKQFLDKFNILE